MLFHHMLYAPTTLSWKVELIFPCHYKQDKLLCRYADMSFLVLTPESLSLDKSL